MANSIRNATARPTAKGRVKTIEVWIGVDEYGEYAAGESESHVAKIFANRGVAGLRLLHLEIDIEIPVVTRSKLLAPIGAERLHLIVDEE